MQSNLFIVLRGLPGSGKSTLCRAIEEEAKKNKISFFAYGADMFFSKSGKFRFDGEKLIDAHRECYEMIAGALRSQTNVVVLDNTNIRRIHFHKYIALAERNGYEVKVIVLGGFTDEDVAASYERNIHKVPFHTIQKMALEFEP